MKIDRSKLKKSTSDIPPDCQALIEKLTSTSSDKSEFLKVLQSIETWTYGKCELLHWVDVLDACDEVLESAAKVENSGVAKPWTVAVDTGDETMKDLVLWTLNFTTFLIEHSFSRHLYSSMEHLTTLLQSCDLDVVLAVLNLLYMFSKRSNFITRLGQEKRAGLLGRLTHLAASWGGRDNGFALSKCCVDSPIETFPSSATSVNFEYYVEIKPSENTLAAKPKGFMLQSINLERVDRSRDSASEVVEKLLENYQIPCDRQVQLFTYVRLARAFPDYNQRLKCVQARLQALSILIYSNQLTDNAQSLLYTGLLEELVEVLEMKGQHLMEIKAAALKALTAIIHLDRNPNFPKLSTIIDVTGASSYHGFLPVLVRNCITVLTSPEASQNKSNANMFPQPLATALFSFLYHLASYEAGGEALVSCGMMESLLKVVQWPSSELDHITFVTRAVRVIDLITNLDMQSFQAYSGLTTFITRLALEVEHCRKQQPFQIPSESRHDSLDAIEQQEAEEAAREIGEMAPDEESMEIDEPPPLENSVSNSDQLLSSQDVLPINEGGAPDQSEDFQRVPDYSAAKTGLTCLPQRAALLKSMLNFLKKAISDSGASDSIRHVMDGSLPESLKHIISNCEYYGPSLFLLATDVVTAYVFQEPSLLSSLQDNGLTDVVLRALLVKDVPATKEVLGSLPNVFSALCLNSRGLTSFVACKPFERLFKVLLSPDYLPAMRRRSRTGEANLDTASNLGNAMDELMRHQPSLRESATGAIIKLLEELCALGRDPKKVVWKAYFKQDAAPPPQTRQSSNNEGGSSDEEDDEEDEPTNGPSNQEQNMVIESHEPSPAVASPSKEAVPLLDYISNVMKFVDSILSNNSTDDHCREFVNQKGLVPLMGILGLPNLTIDFPSHVACQAVASVSKSILNLAHEPQVLKQGLLHLNDVLKNLEPLHKPLDPPGGSVLLRELVSSPNINEAVYYPQATPLLHSMAAAHSYIQMFIHVCRTSQADIRIMSVGHWGSELGLTVLRGLSKLYSSLVWESSVMLALINGSLIPKDCEFGKTDIEKLLPPDFFGSKAENDPTLSPSSGTSGDSGVTAAMESLTTDSTGSAPMEVDEPTASGSKAKEKQATPAQQHQTKQLKPVLGCASRLGRSLAELFALLVKLCVGSPLRQRRGQQLTQPQLPPGPAASAVAGALSKLLTTCFTWEPPSTCPVPRFRLTFFTCSVGFTSPMLFDEKKFPFHLMLFKFISSGGQNAFFDAFDWALECFKSDAQEIPEVTGEFLDSWLQLLEKMVNPKTILESPHVLQTKMAPNSKRYDPMKYLARAHRMAFKVILQLWGKKPLKVFGGRMTESVLSIICHILRGEKLIASKQEKEKAKTDTVPGPSRTMTISRFSFQPGSSLPIPPSLNPQPVRELETTEPEINQEILQILLDMGFPRERCVEAIEATTSLDQATDYLLRPPAVLLGNYGIGLASGMGEQEDLARALAMSLGDNVMVSTDASSETPDSRQKEEDEESTLLKEEFEPLNKQVIDDFTNEALQGCLCLLDSLPNTVYRVCDLLISIFNRNGPEFKQATLNELMQEVQNSVDSLLTSESCESVEKYALHFTTSAEASKTAVRIHLFTLLFEECKMMCAGIIYKTQIMQSMTKLLTASCHTLLRLSDGSSTKRPTPKWMTPMLLFIDLYEKVVLGIKRKLMLASICERKWKVFDVSTGKWSNYQEPNNKTIDDAYWAGESSVRVQFNRKKYIIQFATMMQVNEDTGNRRPVMISLAKNKADVAKIDSKDSVATAPQGMSEKDRCDLLKSCVALIKVPVDGDALNAVMRLSLRLTQDYELAVQFAELGGIKTLFELTHASSFSGFMSLAALLIRHVMEDKSSLRYTIEKVIRSQTSANGSTTTKELHHILRNLAPAACRATSIFSEVSREILRVDTTLWKRGEPEDDPRLLMHSLPSKVSLAAPPLPDVATSVIKDLLNFLILVYKEAQLKDGNVKSQQERKDLVGQLEANFPPGVNLFQGNLPQEDSSSAPSPKNDVLKENGEDASLTKPSKHLMTKAGVCKLLSELVKCYGNCAKVITEHVYLEGSSELITEETSALAFMLDELLIGGSTPASQAAIDKDCPTLVKTLLTTITSCSHYGEAEMDVISEVKSALGRALSLSEGSVKHSKIQALTNLICMMIENSSGGQVNALCAVALKNQVIKVMVKKGLVTDLARVPHSLDLSSPNVAQTINACLKPLEIMSRIINTPTPMAVNRLGKPKPSDESGLPSDGAALQQGEAGTNTTNSEATRAQGDETLELDCEATEHDISTAAESIDPISESHLQAAGESTVEELDDVITQLIDADNGGPHILEEVAVARQLLDDSNIFNEVSRLDSTMDETHGSQMLTQDQSAFENQQMSQDEEDDDSTDGSHSDATEENEDLEGNGMEEDNEDEDEDEDDDDDEDDGDEDDDDDDDDDDEEDDDDDDEGNSHFEDDIVEESALRFPTVTDQDSDDIEYLFYPEHNNDMILEHLEDRGRRSLHLPMWSDVGGDITMYDLGANGGAIVYNGNSNTTQGSNAVTSHHPMLMGRQGATDVAASHARTATRSALQLFNQFRIQRNRSLQRFVHVSRVPGQSGANLQNLIGAGNPHDLITHGLRRGTPLLVDVGYILDGNEMDLQDTEQNSQIARAASLSAIPSSLSRWMEESRVIDGDSMHDCMTLIKPEILEVIEQNLEVELADRRSKKKKQDEEEAAKKVAADAALIQKIEESTSEVNRHYASRREDSSERRRGPDLTLLTSATQSEADAAVDVETVPTSPVALEEAVESICNSVLQHPLTAPPEQMDFSAPDDGWQSNISASVVPEDSIVTQTPLTPIESRPDDTSTSAPGEAHVVPSLEAEEPMYTTDNDGSPEDLSLPVRLGILEAFPLRRVEMDSNEVLPIVAQGAATALVNVTEPIAGPSGVNARIVGSGEDYSAILGIDVRDLPEGVDPSFLAALPEDMRLEVIEEQRRLQSIRQRAAQNTEAGVTEVNPEFLAALPPNIQEEVLTQQRIELQRQAAAANPEAPVDAGEFLSTLPASLRQSVLADLEDSQLPSLPADIAAEAQTLRREFEQRNRAAIHDRYFSPGSAALSSILRNTVNRLGNQQHQYVISSLRSAARDFRDDFWRTNQAVMNAQSVIQSAVSKPTNHQGRFLLDNEALSCLLILLFIDDQKINTTRLHRILRNVCYHGPTREWVVRSLLSILEKANEKCDQSDFEGACSLDAAALPTKGKKATQSGVKPERNVPSWLNISLDAAIGSRANIFQVTKGQSSTKKSNPSVHVESKHSQGWTITIHPGAAVAVCRHTLEVLISLSKSFPMHFIPQEKPTSSSTSTQSGVGSNSDSNSTPKSKQHLAASKKDFASDFWETLLRLDQQSKYSKKGKNLIRIQNYTQPKSDEGEEGGYTFESSPFGQLFTMLSNPVVNRSSVLTDKLLRLLSYISLGQSEMSKVQTVQNVAKQKGIPERFHDKTIQPKADHIQLVVQVLTSKSCSEEGLEDVTSLLLNLSHGPRSNREQILSLLLAGARELGNVVRQNILDLKHELQDLLLATPTTSGTASNASPTDEEADSFENRHAKGSLIDRFTRESVVVTAPSKVKGGSELQLPSMSALTTKTSSQTFFLRLLKVIIQLRETVLLDIKAMRLAETVKDKSSKVIILSGGARVFSTGLSSSQAASGASTAGATGSASDSEPPQASNASVPSLPQSLKAVGDTNTTPIPMEIEDSSTAEEAREGSVSPPLPDCLPSLSDELGLDSLWEALSECLKDLAHTSDHHAVLVLQATVEAFFLVHAAPTRPDENRRVREKETRSDQLAHILEQPLPSLTAEKEDGAEDVRASTPGPSSSAVVELPPDTQKFLAFAETHRTVLNQILRQSTVHLADGPFSVLVDHTRVLDFDIKRRYFRTELDRMDENSRREDLAVHVRRDNVFEDSFRELHRRSPEEWKNRFYIVFEGEEGQDAGGLLREWYVIISKEIFNPMYALFKTSPGDKVTYMIYESSDTNPNHLDYFKFVGRVIAKAIYDNKHLECYFSRSFYKHILAKLVKYTDMESEDYAFYKGLEFLLEHKVEDLGYEPMFSVEIQEFGVTEVRDLIANGRNIKVTEANKLDYIRLVCQMKMTGAIRKQLTAFLEGFYSIIPRRLISIFNEQELELLLSGLPTIDIEDLKNNTEYHKYQPNSLQIVWFWRALRSFDMTDKAKFLQFVTGSSKVPLQGFATLEGMNGAQKFQIHRDDRSTDRLPSAHTCFNQLDLPAYETFDKLKSYLLKAIRECSEGFGFA